MCERETEMGSGEHREQDFPFFFHVLNITELRVFVFSVLKPQVLEECLVVVRTGCSYRSPGFSS